MKISRIAATRKLNPLAWLLGAIVIAAGCAAPDLKPFSQSTSAMTASGRRAGDLTAALLARESFKTNGQVLFPGDPDHPSTRFASSWQLRREAFADIESYAASLAALGKASENSEENVKAVLTSLKELAANVPTFGPAFNAAGDLVVGIGQTAIEIKAYREISKLVNAAHPLVRRVAAALQADLRALAVQYESAMRHRLKLLKDEAEAPTAYYDRLRNELETMRNNNSAPALLDDDRKRTRILRLQELIAGVAPEVTEHEAKIAASKQEMDEGLIFFAQLSETLSAWLQAHEQLAEAVNENRIPNLALLVARAEELKTAAENLRRLKSES